MKCVFSGSRQQRILVLVFRNPLVIPNRTSFVACMFFYTYFAHLLHVLLIEELLDHYFVIVIVWPVTVLPVAFVVAMNKRCIVVFVSSFICKIMRIC